VKPDTKRKDNGASYIIIKKIDHLISNRERNLNTMFGYVITLEIFPNEKHHDSG